MNAARLYLFSALALLSVPACSSGQQGPLFSSIPGHAALRVSTTSEEGVRWLALQVTDGARYVLVEESVHPDPLGSLALDFQLPPGNGYELALSGETVSGFACAAAAVFDVAGGRSTDVAVELVCAQPDAGVAAMPAPACPSVSIAPPYTALPVGSGVVLTPRIEGDAGPSPASACDGLAGACHLVDPGDGVLHECHQLGHQGDGAACAAGRDGCIGDCGAALCAALASLCHDVDPGSGALHECHQLGHAADPAACFTRGRECFEKCSAASAEPILIQFAATVGGAPLACGGAGAPAGGGPVELRDFRFFVHDVQLIDSNGSEAAVELDERPPFQGLGTALLDFEDATGSCSSGDADTNAVITGRVRPGTYTGVRFKIGVPELLNHADPALQPAPLGAGTMSWGWLAGYKFLRAELGGKAGGASLHLGTTACTGQPAAGTVSCARSNRPSITLAGFDPTLDTIVADLNALLGTGSAPAALSCHSTEPSCGPLFAALGLDLQSGSSGGEQHVFRLAR